jgi:hypothetical protein
MAAVIRQDLDKALDEAVTTLSESELREKVWTRLPRTPPPSHAFLLQPLSRSPPLTCCWVCWVCRGPCRHTAQVRYMANELRDRSKFEALRLNEFLKRNEAQWREKVCCIQM